MERELPTEGRLAALRRASRHPVPWILVGVLIGWRVYSGLTPRIEKVDLGRDGRLIVSGRGFGGAKGRSTLVFGGKENRIAMEVHEWRDHRVVAVLQTATSGSVTLTRDLWLLQLSDTAAVTLPLQDLPSQPHGYSVPVQPAAPWPLFRRDQRNTGQSRLPAQYNGGLPWSFQTGGAITAAPVIDQSGIVYFGSADGFFYAVGPDGSELWRFRTGGPISAAAALVRPVPSSEPPSVLVPSSDRRLHRLSTEPEGERLLWTFEAPVLPRSSAGIGFAGGVAIGHDGTIYAGSEDRSYYALTPAGELKWIYKTGDSARSTAAVDASGTIFWGGGDGLLRAVGAGGTAQWTRRTLGVVAASATLGGDGNLYAGSFDSHFYALTPGGNLRWTFKTDDHIAATAALSEDERGNVMAVYVGSADGRLYALDSKGALLWEYDTGEPIRSSAAVGLGPKGESPGIVYVGSANGKLYALDAGDGRRRWSFDTTAGDPLLRDRNDLNSSVALGWNGIYVGSESGALWYVPYDYCLHAQDDRCSRHPHDDLPREHAGLAYVSPGGTTYLADPPPVSPASAITLRLIVRRGGKTVDAHLCHTPLLCSAGDIRFQAEPPFSAQVEPSSDGKYLHIVPAEILRPDTEYRLRIEAPYFSGGFDIGNLTLGGTAAGTIVQELALRTQPAEPLPLGLDGKQAATLLLERIGLPLPTVLPSLHQASIDGAAWALSTIYVRQQGGGSRGRFVMWGIGAQHDGNRCTLHADVRRTLPLNGRYEENSFVLSGADFDWVVGELSVPVQRFELRGQLGLDLGVRAGGSLTIKAATSWAPSFDSRLVLGGLLSNLYDSLLLSGTYVIRACEPIGAASNRREGLRVSMVERARPLDGMPGKIVADLDQLGGQRYKAAEHRIDMVLIDRVTDELVPMDYVANTYVATNAQGEAVQVILSVSEGVPMSHDVEIVVVVDGHAVHRADLGWSLPLPKAPKRSFWGR